MKQHACTLIASLSLTALLPTAAVSADVSSNAIGPPGGKAVTKAQAQALSKPDLIVLPASDTKLPMFAVKNVGTAKSGQSMVQVQCHTVSGAACMPDVHYSNVPAAPPSPGTMMTAPNMWRIPVGALDAAGGEVKLHISVLPKNQIDGLKFNVCADVTAVIAESSETNNCATFVFKLPQ
jgi:hypothetical protein